MALTSQQAVKRVESGTPDPRELGSGVSQYPVPRTLVSELQGPKAAPARRVAPAGNPPRQG